MAYDAIIHETPETPMRKLRDAAERYRVQLPSGRAEQIRRAVDLGLRAPLNAAPVNHDLPVPSGSYRLNVDTTRAERAIERYGFWLGAAAEEWA